MFRKKKLKFYSNKGGDEFAIRIDSEKDFKAVSNPSTNIRNLLMI